MLGYSINKKQQQKTPPSPPPKKKKRQHQLLRNTGPSHFLWTDGCASLPFVQPINIFCRNSAIPQPRSNTDYFKSEEKKLEGLAQGTTHELTEPIVFATDSFVSTKTIFFPNDNHSVTQCMLIFVQMLTDLVDTSSGVPVWHVFAF